MKRTPEKSTTVIHAAAVLILFVLGAACGIQSPAVPPGREVSKTPLTWPQPPQQPRIRFIRTMATPKDLGIPPTAWQRIWEVVAGRDEEWLIRPADVAARGETIFVVDAGAQALWILNPRTGGFRKIQEAGGDRLVSPIAVALGSSGRVYLADSYLGKIFVYDNGEKWLATISDPRIRRPAGLAYDARRDRLYIGDSAAHRVWIFSGEGKPVGVIGQRGAGNGEFNFPTRVAVDRNGNLFVTDTLNFRVQVFDPDGKFAGMFGRLGDSSGDFASPKGIALDSEGHIYIVEALFDAVQIFDRGGRYLLTFGERGLGAGQFWLPAGIFVDPQDRVYVADSYNQRIQIFQYLAGGGP